MPVDQQWTSEMILRWILMGGTGLVLGLASWGMIRFVNQVDERFGKGEKRMDDLEDIHAKLAKDFYQLRGEHMGRRATDPHEA